MYRHGGTIVGVGLLVVLGLILVVRQTGFDVDVPFVGGGSSHADDALRQEEVPPYTPPAVSDVSGALQIVGDQPLAEPRLTVAVEPPDGAVMMQVSDDPSFLGTAWQPVADQVDVEVRGVGYQMVFARFELGDNTISQTSVVGADIDPTWEAAISSATGPHQPSWVRPFSSTELVVRFEAGRILPGSLEAYDLNNPAPGDDLDNNGGLRRVRRNGEVLGHQVSARTDVIRAPDVLLGESLDVDGIIGGTWEITSSDDPAFANGVTPVSVRHVARPSDGGLDGDRQRIWAVVHDLVITLPQPLQPGATYRITAPGTAPGILAYETDSVLSPAVRINQVGFAPDDRPKTAFVAGWFDGMGDTAVANSEPTFRVYDRAGAEVFQGTGALQPTGGDELGLGDLSGTTVVRLDFSPVTEPGHYRVCVDGVGCSHEFEIADDVWSGLATTVARAAYHQRSGLQLGPPHTAFVRPRGFHPDDGIVTLHSDYTLLSAQTETENTNFERLAELRTNEVVDGAWGGHFDAGDWDRRIQHLWFVRNAAQLVMLYPEPYGTLSLNIPESGDQVPDLLDEALWSLELFERMQRDDGAIRGGIESSEHPPPNAASWVDDLAVLAYAPDRYSTYVYAGVAAEFSVALRPYDPARADELLASARRAMEWAEQGQASASAGPADGAQTADADLRIGQQRSVAAAAMLMATGESQWHELFVSTATFLGDGDTTMSCHAHTRCDAGWLYLQADESVTDPAIRQQIRDRFLASADSLVDVGRQTAYGWTLENPSVPLIWGLGVGGAPKGSGLMRAYVLSGDERYRSAALRTVSVSLGANPLGRAMLTGVGDDPVRFPQINDIKNGGIPAWPGTPIYGFHDLNSLTDEQWVVDDVLGPAGVSPSPTELPYLWEWYDIDSVAQYNEFTMHQSHGEALLVFGLLAATG